MNSPVDWPATARRLHRRYLEAAEQAEREAEEELENQLRRDSLATVAPVWRKVADVALSMADEASARRIREYAESQVEGLHAGNEVLPWYSLLRLLDQLLVPQAPEVPAGVLPWEAAVNFLRRELDDEKASEIRQGMERDPDWCVKNHMWLGMGIRNALRKRGFDERFLGVESLDDSWADLLREALEDD